MPRPPHPPEELLEVCKRWSDSIANISGDVARIEFFKNELPGFLRKQSLFEKLLNNMVGGKPYPDLRQAQMIDDFFMVLQITPLFMIIVPGVFRVQLWGSLG
jgi:hypothetical protein